MLYTASPIFHRNVFQKPISHTNNNSSEHGGGACDDLRSRVFYNIVIHIRQGSGDTRGTCRSCKCPKAQKAEQARRKRSGDDKSPGMPCPGMCQARGTPSQDGKDSKQKPNDGKPKRNSKKTLKHPSRAQRVASPRIARERVLIRPVARDAVPSRQG